MRDRGKGSVPGRPSVRAEVRSFVGMPFVRGSRRIPHYRLPHLTSHLTFRPRAPAVSRSAMQHPNTPCAHPSLDIHPPRAPASCHARVSTFYSRHFREMHGGTEAEPEVRPSRRRRGRLLLIRCRARTRAHTTPSAPPSTRPYS